MLTLHAALQFVRQAGRGSLKDLEKLLEHILRGTAPVLSPALVNVTAAALALVPELHDGRVLTVNKADGATLTLPAATGSGARFRIIVGTTITSNSLIIQVASAADILVGNAIQLLDGGATLQGFETAADTDTITLNGSTTGGIKGDQVELIDMADGEWAVRLVGAGTGVEATPFSAAV